MCPFMSFEINFEEYKNEYAEKLGNCVNDWYRKNFCRPEVLENIEEVASVLEFYETIKDEFELNLCEIKNSLVIICDKNADNGLIKEALWANWKFQRICKDNDKDYCSDPTTVKICENTLKVCLKSRDIKFKHIERFRQWKENKECEMEGDQQWCNSNQLLVKLNRSEDEFENFCSYEEAKKNIIKEKLDVLKTVNLMTFEYIGMKLSEQFNYETCLIDKNDLVEWLTEVLLTKEDIELGFLIQPTFNIDVKVKQMFIVVLVTSIFCEGDNSNIPRFEYFKESKIANCNLNKVENLSEFRQELTRVSKNQFIDIFKYFVSTNDQIPHSVTDFDFIDNIKFCKDYLSKHLNKIKSETDINDYQQEVGEQIDAFFDNGLINRILGRRLII